MITSETEDACPYCGAPRFCTHCLIVYYSCGTSRSIKINEIGGEFYKNCGRVTPPGMHNNVN